MLSASMAESEIVAWTASALAKEGINSACMGLGMIVGATSVGERHPLRAPYVRTAGSVNVV